MNMRQIISLVTVLLLAIPVLGQTSSQKAAVQLSATVQNAPAKITLAWTSIASTTSITIYRKTKTATSWGSVYASPGGSALSYVDNAVNVGDAYEYKVVRVAGGVTGNGYIYAGVEVAPVDYRGKLILLVDNTFSSSLSSELTALQNDLRGDGWTVLRSDLSRTASVATVRSTVMGHYNSDPQNVKAVYIVGHLAVPYSGNVNPDGHGEHLGAWPCDGYYGELNGNWTDNSVNNSGASRAANKNVPGDGKFDQSYFPSPLELQVGRVDLFDMPAFSASETELMRAYLNKAHGYKVKTWTPQARGLVFDNLQWVSNPLAASAWRNMAPMVGASNVTAANQGGTLFYQLVNNQSYLWTYSSGGGLQATVGSTLTYNGADRVGTTQDFASTSSTGGVFNMSFGSYFGDWDNKNNFLRAPLASGYGLTNCWAAIPAWYFHHMGLGENIGYSALMSMNNTGIYSPITDGWQGSMGSTHLGLMGDPTLRAKMLVPPTNFNVTSASGVASFTWNPSTESVNGYHLYRIDASTGNYIRLTTSPVSGTSYNNGAIPYIAGAEYMVRAVKLLVDPSGSYYNMSIGAFKVAGGASAATDCAGVVGGSALPGATCNDGNPCTTNDRWNASCQCVGTPGTAVASITAEGSTTICTGGSLLLSANTGSGYTYVWQRNGGTISGATSSTYTATLAGSYTVIVNTGGCSATSAATTVTVGSGIAATVTASGTTNFCAGGSVTFTANTGTGYVYYWRRDGSAISGATSNTYTATVGGVYSVVITSGGCIAYSQDVAVTVGAGSAASITYSGSNAICGGTVVVLNANSSSGSTYVWKRDGATISGATSASYIAGVTGSYTVTITNAGCISTSAATAVTVTAAPIATFTALGSTIFCEGGSVTLSASTGSGYTYSWIRNGTAISGATSSTYSATLAGSYSVVVYSGGCSTTSVTMSVGVSAVPSSSITASGSTTICSGASVSLATSTGSGYTYVWKRNGTTISGAASSSYTATLAGAYTVIVTSGACSSTSSAVQVTVGTTPTASITAGGSTSFCASGSVALSAATGSGYTYTWKRNGTTIVGETASSCVATLAGTYTVVVNSNGCTATSNSITVTVSGAPSATITPSGSTGLCSGGSVVLSTATGSGYTYVWQRNGTSISGATSSSYTATLAGSYKVVVSAGGCVTTSPDVVVTVGAAPVATISAGAPVCQGGSVLLSANTGTGFTYQWKLNGVNITGATGSTYAATLNGSYTVAVALVGCSSTSPSTVVTMLVAPTITCSASASAGTVSVSATGGSAPYLYTWSTTPPQLTATATVSTSGTYSVSVKGANGCTSTCSVTINLQPSSVVGCTGLIQTQAQGTWGAPATAYNMSGYMVDNFNAAFPTSTRLTIGCGSRWMRFTSAQSIINSLPTYGTPAQLATGTSVDPGTSVQNTLVGQLVSAKLNVAFDEMDPDFSEYSGLLREAVVVSGTYAGWTVQQVIDMGDLIIGGCSSAFTRSSISSALTAINNGYDGNGTSAYLACPTAPGLVLQPSGTTDAMSDQETLEVSVFPNPVNGPSTIIITGALEEETTTIVLYSMTGAIQGTEIRAALETGVTFQRSLPTEELAPGVYFCRVQSGTRTTTVKLLVE